MRTDDLCVRALTRLSKGNARAVRKRLEHQAPEVEVEHAVRVVEAAALGEIADFVYAAALRQRGMDPPPKRVSPIYWLELQGFEDHPGHC